jgi:hypothetical protein
VNVAVTEYAVEHHYATISQQQVVDALARLAASDTAGRDPGQPLTPVQIYRTRDDDQRRQLNGALFRRLYLADGRITNHEPWSALSDLGNTSHNTLRARTQKQALTSKNPLAHVESKRVTLRTKPQVKP